MAHAIQASAAGAWLPARNTPADGRVLGVCIAVSLALHMLTLSAYRQSLHDPAWHPLERGLAWLTVTLRPPAAAEIAPQRRAPREPRAIARAPDKSGDFQLTPAAPAPLPALPADDRRATGTAGAVTGAAHPIDLDAARRFAREASRSRNGMLERNLPNLAPARPEFESQLARAIARSARPDCRTEYSGMFLLAIPLLLRDTITDSGCKW